MNIFVAKSSIVLIAANQAKKWKIPETCCLHTVDHFSKMIFNDAWGMPSLSEIRLFRQSVNEWKTRKVTGFHLHYCIALRSSGKWMNFWRRSDLYYSEKFHEYVIKGMLELLLCSRVTKILEFLTQYLQRYVCIP